jgi:hypothetical protein
MHVAAPARTAPVTGSLVNLVVALDAEARPLLGWFGLKRLQPDRGFPVFRHAHIALAVAGPGKSNAAAATAHLHAACGFPRDALWINVGIAGHPELAVGTTRVAHAIDDAATGRSWYPPLAVTPPWPSARVATVDRPDLAYETGAMVDMEASGFYPTACRFSTSELVQVVKIVSDNRHQTADRLKPADLTALIGGELDALDLFLHRLGRLSNELAEAHPVEEDHLAPYLARWHFTATQRHQLEEQVRRWSLCAAGPPWPAGIESLNSATAVIRRLAELCDQRALPLR